MGCELYFPAILSAELFGMMVKLTMHWIMFHFGLGEIFLSSSLSMGGLIVISQQSISNDPSSVYVMFCCGNASGDIYKKRHGMSCAAPTCFHSVRIRAPCLGKKRAGLGADKLVRRQNILNTAFHYNKTVSLSHKTNKIHLKDIISHVIHWVAKIQGLLTLGSVWLGNFRPKGNTHNGFEEYTAFISFP